MKNSFIGMAAVLAAVAVTGAARASATSGILFINDPNSLNASIVPSGTPDATFTTGAINYDSNVGGYTIGGFLNNPTFSNQSAAFIANGGAGATINNTFIQITGTLGLLAGNNSFVVGHDDGLVLTIAGFGAVVNQPNPTSFTNTPFNVFNPGAAGNFNFVLDYTENSGPPAELLLTVNNVNPGVPEPAAWALMILGVGGVGAMARRKTARALAAA